MDERMLDMFDLFIFDWDGTLTRIHALRRLNQTFNPHWLYMKRGARRAPIHDGKAPAGALHTRLDEGAGKPFGSGNPALLKLIELSMAFIKPQLQEQTIDTLKLLREHGKKIALLTDANPYRMLRELSRLGVGAYFDVAVSAQEIGALKPSPTGIEEILRATGCADKGRVVYVGDMADDMLAARNAGVRPCAITNGLESAKVLERFEPWRIFSSMSDFRSAL